jgi:hypothetical protein
VGVLALAPWVAQQHKVTILFVVALPTGPRHIHALSLALCFFQWHFANVNNTKVFVKKLLFLKVFHQCFTNEIAYAINAFFKYGLSKLFFKFHFEKGR